MSEEDLIDSLKDPENKPLTISDIGKSMQIRLHTITVINVLPDGRKFIDKTHSLSWVEGTKFIKKKEKVKVKTSEVKLSGEESY